jgi:hypothetical protein
VLARSALRASGGSEVFALARVAAPGAAEWRYEAVGRQSSRAVSIFGSTSDGEPGLAALEFSSISATGLTLATNTTIRGEPAKRRPERQRPSCNPVRSVVELVGCFEKQPEGRGAALAARQRARVPP